MTSDATTAVRLAVIVPTRNRPALAMTSAQSLLAQRDAPLAVVVSDNSATESAARELRDRCASLGDERLLYIRASGQQFMAEHWDWALEQAIGRTDATHFGVQYDRKVSKPWAMARLHDVCERNPGVAVTFATDTVYGVEDGFFAASYPGTERAYEVPTSVVTDLTAAARPLAIGHAWPLLSNCVVPRETLLRMRATFGTICSSFAVDAAFSYRYCAIEDRFVHLDAPLSIMYGFEGSNQVGWFARDTSGTYGDFIELWGDRGLVDAAPIPGLAMGWNLVYHEYNLVQRVAGQERFPPIEWEAYVEDLAASLSRVDPSQREAVLATLVEHGWHGTTKPTRRQSIRSHVPFKRVLRRLRPRRGPAPLAPVFPTEREALDHLLVPRLAVDANALLDPLGPVEPVI